MGMRFSGSGEFLLCKKNGNKTCCVFAFIVRRRRSEYVNGLEEQFVQCWRVASSEWFVAHFAPICLCVETLCHSMVCVCSTRAINSIIFRRA